MKIFPFLKEKNNNFLVLDIGEKFLKGLLLEKNKDKGVIIKKIHCQEIEKYGVFESEDFEFDALLKSILCLLKKMKIKEESKEMPVFLGLGETVLKARIINLSFERETPDKIISKEEAKKISRYLLEEGERKLLGEIYREESLLPQDISVLRTKTLEEKISGYKILSFEDCRGRIIDSKILFIFIIKDYLRTIKKLKLRTGFKEVGLLHEIEGLLVLGEKNSDFSGIFVDIGSNSTKIFSIGENNFGFGFLKMGSGDLSKKICQNFGISENESDNLKIKLSLGKLEKKTAEKIEGIISPLLREWRDLLEVETKKIIESPFPLPANFYLFGGGAFLPDFKDILDKKTDEKNGRENNCEIKNLEPSKIPLQNKSGKELSIQFSPAVILALAV